MSCLDCLAVKQTFFWLSSLQIRIRFDCCCCLTFGERKEGKSISPQLFPFASVFACASISHASLSTTELENKCASTWQLWISRIIKTRSLHRCTLKTFYWLPRPFRLNKKFCPSRLKHSCRESSTKIWEGGLTLWSTQDYIRGCFDCFWNISTYISKDNRK